MRPLLALICLLSLSPSLLFGAASSFDEPEGLCLARKCGLQMARCGIQSECREWLGCVRSCQDDAIKCPSFCGFFYQSEAIHRFSQCVFESSCVDLGFTKFPAYDHGDRRLVPLEQLTGTYWFAAFYGGDHIFDYDCQRFDFQTKAKGQVAVTYSVPLERQGQWRRTQVEGSLQTLPSQAIEVKYDNFVGYHELWYPLAQTEETLLAHICFTKGEDCHDYGTLLLAKRPLEQIPQKEKDHLDALLSEELGIRFGDLKLSSHLNCPSAGK